jgi:hypothetical protein
MAGEKNIGRKADKIGEKQGVNKHCHRRAYMVWCGFMWYLVNGLKMGIKKDPSPGYGEGRKKGKFPTWLASAASGQPGFDRSCAGVRWFST